MEIWHGFRRASAVGTCTVRNGVRGSRCHGNGGSQTPEIPFAKFLTFLIEISSTTTFVFVLLIIIDTLGSWFTKLLLAAREGERY